MASTSSKDIGRGWAKIFAKAWTDEAFKKRLISNPAEVMKEHGVDAPGQQFHQIKVLESAQGKPGDWSVTQSAAGAIATIHLPPKPGHLSDEALSSGDWAGGPDCAAFCCTFSY